MKQCLIHLGFCGGMSIITNIIIYCVQALCQLLYTLYHLGVASLGVWRPQVI